MKCLIDEISPIVLFHIFNLKFHPNLPEPKHTEFSTSLFIQIRKNSSICMMLKADFGLTHVRFALMEKTNSVLCQRKKFRNN